MVVVAVNCGSTRGIDGVAAGWLLEGLAKRIANAQKTTIRLKMTLEVLEFSLMSFEDARQLVLRTHLVLVALSFAGSLNSALLPGPIRQLWPNPDTLGVGFIPRTELSICAAP
jgi:hypothetical protein